MVFGGYVPQSGRRYVCTDFSTGGTGGQPNHDGVDALETDIANTMNMPVESLELHYPIRVRRNALWSDSAGPGQWRGGLGVEREIEVLDGEITLTLREDRHRTRSWGLYGGQPPEICRSEIVHKDGTIDHLPSKGIFQLSAGDAIHCWCPGGAGFGDPLSRDPTDVLEDVVDGKVSVASAEADYGVVVDPDLLKIDTAATDLRRQELSAGRGPITWTYDRGELGKS